MIKIGLFCAAGFSTGMLVNNMKVAAKKKALTVRLKPMLKGNWRTMHHYLMWHF
ncbi:PTS system, cellobiose-specific IIB component [Streptococcus pyogenes]|nr:PTS system, cellobiose-specific IIB component [Streptococcus pyogenes]